MTAPKPDTATSRDATSRDATSRDATSDQSLLRRYRCGSQQAATALYLRYVRRLRRVIRAQVSVELARRVDPEDVIQSVFGSFFRRLDSDLYDVPPGGELWNLFLVMALNKIRNLAAFHRAGKRDMRRAREIEWYDRLPETKGDRQAGFALLDLVIDDTLAAMPEAHRQIVQLRLEGYDVAEIAQKTQRSRRTVERLLQQMRGKLRELLDHHD
jgi:RNA polymerase sigma-70 factor, ECF subfamily